MKSPFPKVEHPDYSIGSGLGGFLFGLLDCRFLVFYYVSLGENYFAVTKKFIVLVSSVLISSMTFTVSLKIEK